MRLVAMAGLPGAGKSTIARAIATVLDSAILSVDPVEAALLRAGIGSEQPVGLAAYVVVEALAAEQLALGHDLIIDAVNAASAAREQWHRLACETGARLSFIEVQCSDTHVHQQRLEGRGERIAGFREPTWDSVQQRRADLTQWSGERLVLDSILPVAYNVERALQWLSAR